MTMFMPSRAINFAVCSSSSSGPLYLKGAKVLLSNKVIRSVSGLPRQMIDPMNLLRGRITEVLVSPAQASTRYKVQIWIGAAEYVDVVAFGDSPPRAGIILEVEERDIISQLTNGRNFPDFEVS
ncbi:hypothetical protein FRB96_001353 [Tulasnella sp. 330]|nr:hypothetical protein FRB96_001353 [Tulasnella sp. 330]KAG8878517.1 hypothetical protein FRB97_002427 [Tulasnella sp. 331]